MYLLLTAFKVTNVTLYFQPAIMPVFFISGYIAKREIKRLEI